MRSSARSAKSFDWEGLIGVKLFSWIAGIALVLAAIFFLKYSVDHGWLGPPMRMAIGVPQPIFSSRGFHQRRSPVFASNAAMNEPWLAII